MQIFNNAEFGQVRIINKDGSPWFVAKDVAEALGYERADNAVRSHVEDDEKLMHQISALGQSRNMTIINESGLYSLIMSSKLASAKKFKKWVTSDVLPSIRKHGLYAADELLANPDLFIKALEELKSERAARKEAENLVEYKNEVINGIVDDIDILTKRNVLNRVVKHKGADFRERWAELYKVFRETYSIDLKARCEGYNKKQIKKKDQLTTVKYAEKFGHMDKLYKIAVRLYESDINKILDELRTEEH
jgi:prophage antirepressor-like protein